MSAQASRTSGRAMPNSSVTAKRHRLKKSRNCVSSIAANDIDFGSLTAPHFFERNVEKCPVDNLRTSLTCSASMPVALAMRWQSTQYSLSRCRFRGWDISPRSCLPIGIFRNSATASSPSGCKPIPTRLRNNVVTFRTSAMVSCGWTISSVSAPFWGLWRGDPRGIVLEHQFAISRYDMNGITLGDCPAHYPRHVQVLVGDLSHKS